MACYVPPGASLSTHWAELGIAIENVGAGDRIVLVEWRPYLSYEVSLTGPGGESVPRTALGEAVHSSATFREVSSSQAVWISTDQAYHLSYPLHVFFNLTVPGRYEIGIARPDWSDGESVLRTGPLGFSLPAGA
jgi:hypothetical protein